MKKLAVLLLLPVILFSLVGCGDSGNQETVLLKNLEPGAVEGMDKEEVIAFLGAGYEEFNIDGSEYIFWTDRGVSGVYEVGIEANEVIYGVWIEGEEGTERLAHFKPGDHDAPVQTDQGGETDAQTGQQPTAQESEEAQTSEDESATLGITIADWTENIALAIHKMDEQFDGVTDYTPSEQLLDGTLSLDLINDYTIFLFYQNEEGVLDGIMILQSAGDGSDEAVYKLIEGQILAVLSIKPDYEIEDCSEILNSIMSHGDTYTKDGITYERRENFEVAGEVYRYATLISAE